MTERVGLCWLLPAAVAWLSAVLPAQVPPPRPRLIPELPPTEETEQNQYYPLSPLRQSTWESPYRKGFQGFESVYPDYPYPTYPEGYGPPERLPAQEQGGLLLPFNGPLVTVPPNTGWPSWMHGVEATERGKRSPSQAVVARMSDRVWLLSPDDNAFVPLEFWDKFRLVEVGAVVEVRTKGEFKVAFSDGASLRSMGPARVTLAAMNEEGVTVDVATFRRLWFIGRDRPFRLTLPGAGQIDVSGAELYLEREDGLATITNQGPASVIWTGRSGQVELAPARRMAFLVAPPASPFLGADLELSGGVRVEHDGRVLVVHGDTGGTVVWSGVRVAVPPGALLRLDPLAGGEFPETHGK